MPHNKLHMYAVYTLALCLVQTVTGDKMSIGLVMQ